MFCIKSTYNTYNAGMYLSGNRTEVAQMADDPCSNGKVSGSIPGKSLLINIVHKSSQLNCSFIFLKYLK